MSEKNIKKGRSKKVIPEQFEYLEKMNSLHCNSLDMILAESKSTGECSAILSMGIKGNSAVHYAFHKEDSSAARDLFSFLGLVFTDPEVQQEMVTAFLGANIENGLPGTKH